MLGSTVTRIDSRPRAQPRPRVGAVVPTRTEAERLPRVTRLLTTRRGLRALRTLLVERINGKGHDVSIVRTEPRDVAPVIPLPVRMHGNRVIQPLDVPVGTPLGGRLGDPAGIDDPGPLARALMALERAGTL